MSTITKCDHCTKELTGRGPGERTHLECRAGFFHFCDFTCLYRWLSSEMGDKEQS